MRQYSYIWRGQGSTISKVLQVRPVIILVLIQDLIFFKERVLKAIVQPPEEFERLLLDIDTEQASVDRSASLVSEESPCLKYRGCNTANVALA